MINIVIDADIASAAGTTAHPVSSSCRLLLNLVHDNGHSVSYCKKLRKEWDDHQSHYFIDWRALMFTKKRLHLINHNEDFNTSIAASDAADEIKAIACKDSHLLDIAAANGRSIASQDEKAKAAFYAIPEIKHSIREITWINPTTDVEDLQKIFSKNSHNISNEYKCFK